MKIEQQARGTAATQDVFIGEEGQITADIDNWDLRLHDGETPGGNRLINRDNGDQRWQAKSPELDGFTFPPEARGQVTRLGTGNYKIRRLTVNGQQFNITNADGYNANPYIELAERIETSHIFGGDILIEGVLQVDGGINGDTSGTHFGPVVGNVTGNVTGNLTGNASGAHTGSMTGDVDVRGETLQLDDGQIPLEKISGLLSYILNNALFTGAIIMWSGIVDDIPTGWFLCNGLNGTPDLTGKFIVGAGGVGYDPGDTGGASTHGHTVTMDSGGAHSHTVTVAPHALTENEIPSHRHANGVCDNNAVFFNRGNLAASPSSTNNPQTDSAAGTIEGYTSNVGGGAGHSHSGAADSAGSHTHALNNPSASSLPPYYALCYIMRVVS